MRHFSEEDLIAYQMRESSDEAAVRRHLEMCEECAAMSDSIAETLRVFSAGPAPQPDLERNWQRLRGNLSVLTVERPRRRFAMWVWPAAGLVAASLLAMVGVVGVHVHREAGERPKLSFNVPVGSPLHGSVDRPGKVATNALPGNAQPGDARPLNGHGPLTTQPVDPAVADHLDAAERLLTEVNNTKGPLDETTRDQAHGLLLKNAMYVRTARENGDVAEAAVLEDLGRVLTTLDNEPETQHSAWRLRLEMNTNGLLLDIRILRQNDDGKGAE